MYGSNRSLKEFEWLVEDNPAGRAILFIAIKDEEVVGMQSLIPYCFMKNGELIDTYKSEDSLVAKNMRGKGIYSRLYQMVHEYVGDKLIWGLTDKKEILEHVNMPSSERLTIAVAVKRPSLSYDQSGLQKFVAKTLFYTFLYLKSTFQVRSFEHSMDLKEVKPSKYGSQKFQSFFIKISKSNPEILYPDMNEGYLNWRLEMNPNLEEYKIYCSFDEKEEIAICSIIGFKGKAAYWQSLYKLPSISETEVMGHISQLRNIIFSTGVTLIHSWLFECNDQVKDVKDLFYNGGFSKVREGLWIVHNSTDKEIDVHNLYFSPQLGIR